MLADNFVATHIASRLLQIKAIQLNPQNPFTWASGLKSPIYCDNRKSLSHPELRDEIKNNLTQIVKTNFIEVDVIAGVATAGIPHGVLVADETQLPFVYVRSTAKGHGLENQIEGDIEVGQQMIVVEDLISTGMSSINAVKTLQEAGCKPIGVIAIFTYGFPDAHQRFEDLGIPLYTLTDYEHLLKAAVDMNHISKNDLEMLQDWQYNKEIWPRK